MSYVALGECEDRTPLAPLNREKELVARAGPAAVAVYGSGGD